MTENSHGAANLSIHDVSARTFIGHDQVNYGYNIDDVEHLIDHVLAILQAGGCFTLKDGWLEAELNGGRLQVAKDAGGRFEKMRHERAYLLGLTLHHTYRPWETLYVPLAGRMDNFCAVPGFDLPMSFQEIIPPPPGSGPEAQLRFVDLDDITAAMDRHEAFIILGEPGAGKTTTLYKIILREARAVLEKQAGRRIPLFVRLSQQKGRPVFDFLQAAWEQHMEGSFKDALAQGRLLALVDGVNEIAADQRGAVLKDWREFVGEWSSGNRFIFSGRRQDYSQQLNLSQVVINPLDEKRIADYLERYGAQELLPALKDPHGRLGELAQNPFFLMLLTQASRGDRHSLDNRGKLLDDFAHRLFMREQGLAHSGWIEEEAQRQALAQMAFSMQEQGSDQTFDFDAAAAAIPASLRVRGRTQKMDAENLFWLGRQATLLDPAVEDDVRFYHQLLQEYFAALELLRRFAAGEDLSRLWQAPRLGEEMPPADVGEWDPLPPPPSTGWEVTTLLAVGLAGQLLSGEAPGGKRHPGKPGVLLQAVCKVNPALAGRGLLETGLDDLKPLVLGGLAVGLETEESALRAELEAGRGVLREELYNPAVHLRVRLQAGEVLGRLGDPRLKVDMKNGVRVILPEMIPVPGGRYRIGSRRNDGEAFDNERPSFEIELEDFSIGRRPVTNAEFACFIEAGGYANPAWWQTGLAQRWLTGEEVSGGQMKTQLNNWQLLKDTPDWRNRLRDVLTPDAMSYWERVTGLSREAYIAELSADLAQKSRTEPAFWHREGWNLPNQPVTGVTWFEAGAYGAWMSAASGKIFHLPPEPCWEAAARGMDGNAYPWGMEWQADLANTLEGRVMRPSPAGAYAAGGGLGPGGAEDQAGNVYEWTASLHLPYPYEAKKAEQPEADGERTLRGGAWDIGRRYARCAFRDRNVPDDFDLDIGFRLFSPGHS